MSCLRNLRVTDLCRDRSRIKADLRKAGRLEVDAVKQTRENNAATVDTDFQLDTISLSGA